MSHEERERLIASLPGIGQEELRFCADSARLHELIIRLVHVAERMGQRGKQEARRAEEEARHRQEAEQRVAELQAELEQLRGR